MTKKQILIEYEEYNNSQELNEKDETLLRLAREAANRAYAPYSKFKVGAALLLANGEFISANNQENAAYPSGLCAERVALFYAHSQFPNQPVVAIAVVAFFDGKEIEHPTYPCGSCRQVMAESELRGKNKVRVILGGSNVVQVVNGVSSLLPFVFDTLPK